MISEKKSDKKTGQSPELTDITRLFDKITEQALFSGAAATALIAATDIRVDEKFAQMCREPGCENFSLSMSCPPHVGGPEQFRKWQQIFDHAIIIKIDVPMVSLLSQERQEIMRLLHNIVSEAEAFAVQNGYTASLSFAGGSCKSLFCSDFSDCRVLNEKKPCRNPALARPSMSGFGIDVAGLMKTAGWSNPLKHDRSYSGIGTVCGLVLIG